MKGQILILDDNLIDIKVLSLALEKYGYACYGFTDHQTALDWVESNKPTHIFLDLQMPSITGYDLIPIFRAKENTSETPIIIVSGKNQSEDVVKAIRLGANDYIIKPIDPMVLQEKVGKDSQDNENFYSVSLGTKDGIPAYIAHPIRIHAASEFGLIININNSLLPGDTIEIGGLPADFFGDSKLILRCLSCIQNQDNTYLCQTTFIGMKESQRQVIRKNCRQLWIQNKKGSI